MSRSLFVLAFSAFVLHSVAVAQVDTGTISGTVKDQTGAVIQDATVKVENRDTGIAVSLSTNADGLYLAPDLKAGFYRVSAVATGFQTLTKNGIELRVQDRIPVTSHDSHHEDATASVQEAGVVAGWHFDIRTVGPRPRLRAAARWP